LAVVDTERLAALAGDPDAELKRLEGQIRAQPGDARLRTYLFQLLALRGDWDRAIAQLQVTAQLTAAALPMAQAYREAIRSEVYRAEVFGGRRTPSLLGTPPAWTGLFLEALKATGAGRHDEAARLREQALDMAPATPGRIGDAPFEWIADADSRIGPMCEAIVDGKYVWIPFEHLASVSIEPPTDLRDFIWSGAHLSFANGGDTVALVPTRYPGSERASDPALRMARKTEWQQVGEDAYIGLGQRMWATDAGEHAMLDVRDITLGAAG
jgi:type VI secretion system protein ImpE